MNRTTLDEPVYLNGINADTGEYLSEPVPLRQWFDVVRRQGMERDPLDELRYRVQSREGAMRGVMPEYGDGSDLSKAGWGMVFPAQADPQQVQAILQAMGSLVERRRDQTGPRFRIYQGRDGFRWNRGRPESKNDFLQHNGAGVGPVDPKRMPYYLLIVADPQSIPFRFQYELDVQYAVGRIYFQTLEEYAAYARSVVMAEEASSVFMDRDSRQQNHMRGLSMAGDSRPQDHARSVVMAEDNRSQGRPRAVFFGVANPDDPATQTSAEHLIAPLYRYAAEKAPQTGLGWQVEQVPPTQADRQTLLSLLGGARTPAFLMTAGHGWSWLQPDARQTRYQGALVCQDWQGPRADKVSRAHVVAGEDIPDEAVLTGSVIFHFACYSAGTPYWPDTGSPTRKPRQPAAFRPFLGALPTRLLGLPEGGALAVIGHVERAWSYSFRWGRLDSQTQSYQSLLFQLMSGKPVGLAMEQMNMRYAEIATMLAHDLAEASAEPDSVDPLQLFSEWTATNDARSYVVLGDPAARIPMRDVKAVSSAQVMSNPRQPFPGRLPAIFAPPALAPFSEEERQAILREETADTAAETSAVQSPAGQERELISVQTTADEMLSVPEQAVEQLREKAAELLRALACLEVRTQVSGAQTGSEQAVMLITRIQADGSLETTQSKEALPPDLLRTHEAMVRQATERQVELLKELSQLLERL